jgi:ribosomal protein S18 acetylase RimI-like enzyme
MKADSLPFNIQHPTPDDLERVFNFMIECDIAEFGEADSDKDDLADQWSEADLTADAWIASNEAGELIGYTLLSDEFNRRRYLDLYLHTVRSPQGLAEALLDKALERFSDLVRSGGSAPECILTAYANGLNPGIRTAYESHGFTVEKFHYRMQMDFNAPYPATEWPAGFALAPVTPAEEKDLHALIISAFDWQGVEPLSFDDWHKQIFRGGRYDPELFLMLHREGQLVGAAICYDEDSRIWLKELAVSKELQGQGIGSLLLRQVFALAGQRGTKSPAGGIPTVALGVVSLNPKAVEFYERSGMARTREFVQYHRKV